MQTLLFLIVLAVPSYPVVTTQTESVSPAAWTVTSMTFHFDGSTAEIKLQGCSASPCTVSNRMEGTETVVTFTGELSYSTITGWLAENDTDVGDSEVDVPGVQCTFNFTNLFPESNPDAPEVELKDLLDTCKLIN